MRSGKAFELLVKRILINIGFSEVASDKLYIFDAAPGQMIQGLGEAHNADVLLEPPVQTPFYTKTRLLVECKDYKGKIGLGIVRGVLGLREDINHFEIVDEEKLKERRKTKRRKIIDTFERCSYQVAIAAMNGYTVPAQNFAATYRIPLLEFDRMPFWLTFCQMIGHQNNLDQAYWMNENTDSDAELENQIINFADYIGQRMALAITDSGQMLFLYLTDGNQHDFSDDYSLHWTDSEQPWELRTGENTYSFQLPDNIMRLWLNSAANELELKREAIKCKSNFFSNMAVYYVKNGRPAIKMISIDKVELESARKRLR